MDVKQGEQGKHQTNKTNKKETDWSNTFIGECRYNSK